MKIGSSEKKILSMARQFGTVKNTELLSTDAFKSLIGKDCLERVDYGEFKITEKGRKELSKREAAETGSKNQQGLGDFS